MSKTKNTPIVIGSATKSGSSTELKKECLLCGDACYINGEGSSNVKNFMKGKWVKTPKDSKLVCFDCCMTMVTMLVKTYKAMNDMPEDDKDELMKKIMK